MNNLLKAQRNWSELPDLLERGVQTLPQLLVYQADKFKDRAFHRKKDYGIWQCYSWKDVLSQVQNLSMGLRALGVKSGHTIAIVGENEPELFWSEYAIQAIGAKVVCLYPDLTADQMEYILVQSEAVGVICEDQEQVDKALELEQRIPAIRKIIYWDERGMWNYDHPNLTTYKQVQEIGQEYLKKNPDWFRKSIEAGKGTDIAALCYTSGTTGYPKGCIMTHNYLLDSAYRIAGAIRLKTYTQYLSYISPAWATEQMFGLTAGLLVPLTVNFPEEPETVQENIREIGAEALVLSPRQWESLASLVEAKMMNAGPIRRSIYRMGMRIGRRLNLALLEGKRPSVKWHLLYRIADKLVLHPLRDNLGLQSVYLPLSGGSGMAPDVFRFFHSLGVKLRNTWGSTEIGIATIHQGDAFDLETVGNPCPIFSKFGPPLEFKVTDEGELLIRGGTGFTGYYKKPEAAEEKTRDGWFCTGDVVSLTEKGDLIYLERIEDMRRLSTGHVYPPQFMENRLRFSPFIKDAMVLGDNEKPFVAAFINIDANTMGSWAEQRNIGYTTFTDLSQNQRIRHLIGTEIEKVNAFLSHASKIRRFINLPKELDPDEDELTRSRKIRRKFLERKYGNFIDAIYGGEKEFWAEVPVKYQDGRIGTVHDKVHINDLADNTVKQELGNS